MSRRAREQGQVSVLLVGLFMVAVLLVMVVVDASAAYLRRQQLDALADGAALAAVQGIEEERLYVDGVGKQLDIDPAAARAHVAAYLRQVGAHRDPHLSHRVMTTDDSVTVSVATRLQLPFAPPGWAERTRVTGTAASYVEVVE